MDIKTIDKEAQRYAEAREELAVIVANVQQEQSNIRRQYLPQIRRAVAKAKERRAVLQNDVETNPDLFRRPKSKILHGIKLGWKKAKGKIAWSDNAKLLKRLREVCPKEAKQVIKIEEKVMKGELQKLPAATLKKLGVTITEDQDIAFVEATDTEVDRLVTALLEENKDLEEAA